VDSNNTLQQMLEKLDFAGNYAVRWGYDVLHEIVPLNNI